MNKLVYSALALTLVSAQGFATENEWSSLDQEINSLNSSLAAQNATGPKVGGWIITTWTDSGDLAGSSGGDLQGFALGSTRIEITGDAGSDYGYKISFALESGTLLLRDAYATFKIGDMVTGKLGNFKIAFLRSSNLSDNKLLFLERTALGDVGFWNAREVGLQFAGNFDTIHWALSATNGADGTSDDYQFAAKVWANLMGNGVGKVEGAYGAGDETALTGGLAWTDDGFLDDGTAIAVEVALTVGPFGIAAELVDFDDGTGGAFGFTDPILAQVGVAGADVAGTTPWDVTASYLFTEMWEAAFRFQDSDSTDDTTEMGIAVNYYVQGHDIKWTGEWRDISTDNASGDISLISVGLTVGF